MKVRELLWSARALAEYDDLIDYLWFNWGENILLRVTDDLNTILIRIQENPEHFPIVIKRKDIRRCVFSPQTSIFFTANKNLVKIVSIFDNRQNPNKLKKL